MRIAAASSLCHGARNQQLVSTRARELAALRHEWQRSTSGELRVALVLGDAGTGKTRLADELVPRCTKFPIRL